MEARAPQPKRAGKNQRSKEFRGRPPELGSMSEMAMLCQLTQSISEVHNSGSVPARVPMNMRALIFLRVAIVSVASAQEFSDASLIASPKSKYLRLAPSGMRESLPRGRRDYKLILARPSAAADLERLLSAGNAQGKSTHLSAFVRATLPRFKEISVVACLKSGCRPPKEDALFPMNLPEAFRAPAHRGGRLLSR